MTGIIVQRSENEGIGRLPCWNARVAQNIRGPGMIPRSMARLTSTSAYIAPSVSRSRIVVFDGAFDRHPDLRVVFVEGGFLWHRPVIARLARHWDHFQKELEAAKDDPFDYMRQNVRFTSQPIEEVARLLELAEANKTLMFSSDYPHYDYDEPKLVLPRGVSEETRRRIMCENARELYDLPRTRPVTAAEQEHA